MPAALQETQVQSLKRAINPMPDDVRGAREAEGLEARYGARPPYQQNDYLGWIGRARRDETRRKRIETMLRELREASRYIGMSYTPRRGPDTHSAAR
jgi:uncharacterized protein YdeI (YjbR/CyaY-like superfamily)